MESNSTTWFIVIIMILIIMIIIFAGISFINTRKDNQRIFENRLLSEDFTINNQLNQNKKKISLEDRIKNELAKNKDIDMILLYAISMVFLVLKIVIVLSIIRLIPFWIIFAKNSEPGWAILIPFYNKVVLYRIVKIQTSYAFFGLIPFVGPILSTVIYWYAMYLLVKKYDKGIGFFFGIMFLPIIFLYILAFSTATDNNKMFFDKELRDDEIQ